jgi:hypothetical protein
MTLLVGVSYEDRCWDSMEAERSETLHHKEKS